MSGTDETAERPKQPLARGLVLVADDDLETRAALSELLADLDYWPVATRNGLEALEYLRTGVAPTAMLIDLYMPLMDGESFCAACDESEAFARIPRIIISANEDGPRRVRRCGALGFLPKPIAPHRLELLLAKAEGARS